VTHRALRVYAALAIVLESCAAWAEQAAPGVVVNSATPADQIRQCLADLTTGDVDFQTLGSVTKEGCAVDGAIELDAIASPFGKIAFPGKPTLGCIFARQFTTFVRNAAAPLTLAYLGAKLTAIETGPGLVCRTRYNKPGEKISEHAKGDAIDVTAFRLENGRMLTVKDASSSKEVDGVWIKTLRATGCGYFTTILGPGSNDAHKEHLHFDYEMRGGGYNYRICE